MSGVDAVHSEQRFAVVTRTDWVCADSGKRGRRWRGKRGERNAGWLEWGGQDWTLEQFPGHIPEALNLKLEGFTL